MSRDFFTAYGVLGQRWGWWSAVPITIFWVVLWPVGLAWCTVSLISRYKALDKSPEAKAKRRAARLLASYPKSRQARHGAEFSDAAKAAIHEGHEGPSLTLNTAHENSAARLKAASNPLGLICWSLCWLPLIAQGLVPIILKLTGADVRALFLAFYLPSAYQWPFMIAMVVLGLYLLIVAIRATVNRPARK